MALKKINEAPQFELDEALQAEQEIEDSEVLNEEVEATTKTEIETKTENGNEMTQETQNTQVVEATPNNNQVTKKVLTPGVLIPKGGANINPYENYEWFFDKDTVSSFGPGVFPKMVADVGGLNLEKDPIGKYAIIEIQSVNPRYAITPNENDDEAGSLVRYSYDKVTVENDDRTVEEYLTYLKDTKGYTKSSIKEYGDIWATLYETAEAGVLETPEMIQIQMSPQSLGQWKAFLIKQSMAFARGSTVSERIKIEADRRTFGKTTFGLMKFFQG